VTRTRVVLHNGERLGVVSAVIGDGVRVTIRARRPEPTPESVMEVAEEEAGDLPADVKREERAV
jgi:hypothetical protein